MEIASAARSTWAGFIAERDSYNFLSTGKTDSLETAVNPGSEAVVTACMAGASVAAGAAAGASVAAGAGAPQAEISMPINKIMKKDFRDIKESFWENNLTLRLCLRRNNFLVLKIYHRKTKKPPLLRRVLTKKINKLFKCHLSLTNNRFQYLRIQIPRMVWHSHKQISPFELDMASSLAHLSKTCFFQRGNYLTRFKDRQFRHKLL